MIQEFIVTIKNGFEPHFREVVKRFDPNSKIIPSATSYLVFKLIADISPVDVQTFTFIKSVRWTDPYKLRLMDLIDSFKKFGIRSDDLIKIKDSDGNLVDGKMILDEDLRFIRIEEAGHGNASQIGMDSFLIDFYGRHGSVPVIFRGDIPVVSIGYQDNAPQNQVSSYYTGSGYMSGTSPNFVIFEG